MELLEVRKKKKKKREKLAEEEPWSDKIEALVLKWKLHASKLSELHDKAGYSIKFKHNLFGLPPIFIPLMMSYISQITVEDETTVNGLMFLISGISGALYNWLNLGEQYTLHFQYSARYDDIITSIDSELSRNKRFRRAADAFVTEIKAKIDNLNQTAPEFPFGCCFNFIRDYEDVHEENNDVVIHVDSTN